MTVADLSTTETAAFDVPADVLVFASRAVDGKAEPIGVVADDADLARQLAALRATGDKGEVVRLPGRGIAATIAVVGLGAGPVTATGLRVAAGTAGRSLTGFDTIAFAFPADNDDEAQAVLEGAALGAYDFTSFRQTSLKGRKAPATSVILTDYSADPGVAAAARSVASAVHLVRDLANTPPLDLYPASFVDRVQAVTAGLPIDVTVWTEEELAADGFGGILGVGAGSSRGPRLVKLEYSPDESSRHLALVGKGITFDTGGLSLKPPVSMVNMKYDMTGAATALAVIVAAAELGLPIRLTAWLCLAENMPSGTAIRPNDVLTIRGGTTVEVLNTDAEGRLVLADGLVAASEAHPDAIIDIATLTGAAKIALGDRYIGVMGDNEFTGSVIEAAEVAGESFWRMPLPEEMRSWLNSDVADIANVKIGSPAGGMLVAGVFLQEFVGPVSDEADAPRIPWAHLDIAGAAWNDGTPSGFTLKGPTGVAVRALLTLASTFGRA